MRQIGHALDWLGFSPEGMWLTSTLAVVAFVVFGHFAS